ncbi:MAG: Signal peptide peptidase SppA [Candidatus Tokpelaia sp. JSC188]|nr:MAG: Signal peptide peptidase SppA [Candidatus Tokpelaia sp. JSC188]
MLCLLKLQEEIALVKLVKYLIPRFLRSKQVEVPVVRLQGMITAQASPLKNTLSLSKCAIALEKAFSNKKAPVVALVVNSPGGSPVQSRLIFQRIRDLAEENKKQVLVFVEDIAASGGYMIACAGDKIYADPSSIVGSIGVISSSFGFPELLKKIGIERRVHTSGKSKVSLDPFLPEKKADVEHLKALQLEIHETFITLVRERRSERLLNDNSLFTGLFWTGLKGKELGLIDGLGDIRSILKELYGKETQLRLISSPRGLFSCKAMGGGIQAGLWANAVDAFITITEERATRARYGL